MSASEHHLITEYRRELRRASNVLSPGLRSELREYVDDHLATSLAVGERNDEEVRRVLAGLGEPVHLVNEMRESGLEQGEQSREPSWTERSAIRWLTLGSPIPVAGWLYGVALLWSSRVWSRRDKDIGTLCFPGGSAGVLASFWTLSYATEQRCSVISYGPTDGLGGTPNHPPTDIDQGCALVGSIQPWLGWVIMASVIALAFAGPIWLSRRAVPRTLP